MRITVDTEARVLEVNDKGVVRSLPLFSAEAFDIVSREWINVGWAVKYVYSFSWLGRPIIQLPDDMIRIQEVVFSVQPDIIIETGVAHGGSLVFYATLCKAMGKGRVIGIDIEIRPHNRKAIESHFLFDYITLIENSSIDPKTVDEVKSLVQPGETTLILLDSNHTKSHVLAELDAYASLVSPRSYIVAMDGIMRQVADLPRSKPEWITDNPIEAVHEFLAKDSRFELVEPPIPFNEGEVTNRVTYWPSAFLKRTK